MNDEGVVSGKWNSMEEILRKKNNEVVGISPLVAWDAIIAIRKWLFDFDARLLEGKETLLDISTGVRMRASLQKLEEALGLKEETEEGER